MTTEILGFIIILGAVIVLLARQHLNKSEDDPEVLEAATGRLRYELEQSADEIISRMTEHIDRLERMLREADYKSELLQQKIDMLQQLGCTGQPAPQQAVQAQQPVDYAVKTEPIAAEDVSQPVQAKYQEPLAGGAVAENMQTGGQSPAAVYTPVSNQSPGTKESYSMSSSDEKAWEYFREAAMKLEDHYEAQSNTMQSVQQSDALQQAVNIQTGNIDNLVSAGSSARPIQAAAPPVSTTGQGEYQELDTEAATQQAREMLQDGHELEEIAKATGLGIGAVHLIKQMQEKHL